MLLLFSGARRAILPSFSSIIPARAAPRNGKSGKFRRVPAPLALLRAARTMIFKQESKKKSGGSPYRQS